jgi:phage baseplate assembly protein W
MAIGLSPALPLAVDQVDGPYRLTKTVVEAISQNLKNLILTNPGERMMDPDFGVGIRQFLFELENVGIQSEISSKISKQVKKYLNAVKILDIRFTLGSNYKQDAVSLEESNAMYVHLLYKISSSDTPSVLSLPISR